MLHRLTLHFSKRHPKIGAKPGTLVFDEHAPEPKVRAIRYGNGPEVYEDRQIENVEDLKAICDLDQTVWIDVQGFGDRNLIRNIADIFNIHPLALENIVNIPQRPNAQLYNEQYLIVARMVSLDADRNVQMEQISLLVGDNYVVTFQEFYGDVFDAIRSRISDAKSKIRSKGVDFLAYAIIDAVIDGYYPVVDSLGDKLDDLEVRILNEPTTDSLFDINATRNLLANLRRSVWPQREAINTLIRGEFPISDEVKLYLKDTYDHRIQTAEVIEMYRELATVCSASTFQRSLIVLMK